MSDDYLTAISAIERVIENHYDSKKQSCNSGYFTLPNHVLQTLMRSKELLEIHYMLKNEP